MKPSNVIKKPILTEKAHKLMEKGIYTFLVSTKSTKEAIAKAINWQFAVSVDRVNVASFAPKLRQIARTRKQTKVGGGKKAIVYLKAGQTIAALLPKTKEKPKSASKEKDIQKVSPEGKET